MELRCKKVIVSGGGSGIGLAIAQKLVTLGAQVVIMGRTDSKLRAASETMGDSAHIAVLDVQKIADYPAAIEKACALMGGLDGLVNSAGACAYTREWGAGMFAQTEEDWDRVMNTNVKAPFFLSRMVLQHMMEHHVQGNILNVVSEAAFVPASASYGASKHALRALTAGLAQTAIAHGIVVNGIAPGTTATDFVDIPAEMAMHRQANGRLGTTAEMAELAAFLMSREGENIIGQTILSCGGSSY